MRRQTVIETLFDPGNIYLGACVCVFVCVSVCVCVCVCVLVSSKQEVRLERLILAIIVNNRFAENLTTLKQQDRLDRQLTSAVNRRFVELVNEASKRYLRHHPTITDPAHYSIIYLQGGTLQFAPLFGAVSSEPRLGERSAKRLGPICSSGRICPSRWRAN